MADKFETPPRTATPLEIAEWVEFHCDGGSGKRHAGVTFLIGAGFSASTGIPTAGRMIQDTLRKHPLLKNAGTPPTGQSEYAFLMAKLPPAERIKIIREAIKKAEDPATKHLKINWAHLLLATLVDAGFVNQILTTNFDPLVVEALAVTGQPVRAFDLTASVGFQSGALEASSVIYLHGQAHGLWLTNAPDEMERVVRHLNSVFQDALRDSIFIIVGYSGECDPVFGELILRFPQFRHRLYWVHHGGNSDPCGEVTKLLADHYREAYLVSGYDADGFMREFVLEGLKLELPPIVKTPIASVASSLQRIMPFPQKAGEPPANDPVAIARKVISEAETPAASKISTPPAVSSGKVETETPLEVAIAMAGVAKDLNKLKELRPAVEKSNNVKLRTALGDAWLRLASDFADRGVFDSAIECLQTADELGTTEKQWQAVVSGNVLQEQAKTKSGTEAEDLFKQAAEKYTRALQIKPNMCEALNNWGNTLSGLAMTKTGVEADALFEQAVEKFTQALRIKPDVYDVLYNWGNVLSEYAKTKSGARADALFQKASEKYTEALQIKPDDHEVLNNWGTALSEQAKTKRGAEADALCRQAGEKYARALQIKPGDHKTLNNWGVALSEQAYTKSGAEADVLFQQAGEKYAQALQTEPDMHDALYNWGIALSNQAKTKSGAEADLLFKQAGEKYAQALRIKPDKHGALHNWGIALSDQAKTKSGAEADTLLKQAGEKYAQTLQIRPDNMHDVLNNWGIALSNQARAKSAAEADAFFKQAREKYAQALKIKPDKHEALNNWGIALSDQAKTKTGAEADALFNQASEKYAQALQIKPDDHEVFNNWGTALLDQAKTMSGAEADALFQQAREKYAQALQIKPEHYSAHFNLACLAALSGNVNKACQHLENWKKYKPNPKKADLDNDSDFEKVKHAASFLAFRDSLPD